MRYPDHHAPSNDRPPRHGSPSSGLAPRSWSFDAALLAAAGTQALVPSLPHVAAGTGAAIVLLGCAGAMAAP